MFRADTKNERFDRTHYRPRTSSLTWPTFSNQPPRHPDHSLTIPGRTVTKHDRPSICSDHTNSHTLRSRHRSGTGRARQTGASITPKLSSRRQVQGKQPQSGRPSEQTAGGQGESGGRFGERHAQGGARQDAGILCLNGAF